MSQPNYNSVSCSSCMKFMSPSDLINENVVCFHSHLIMVQSFTSEQCTQSSFSECAHCTAGFYIRLPSGCQCGRVPRAILVFQEHPCQIVRHQQKSSQASWRHSCFSWLSRIHSVLHHSTGKTSHRKLVSFCVDDGSLKTGQLTGKVGLSANLEDFQVWRLR